MLAICSVVNSGRVTAFPLATLQEPCLKTSNALNGKEVYVLIFYLASLVNTRDKFSVSNARPRRPLGRCETSMRASRTQILSSAQCMKKAEFSITSGSDVQIDQDSCTPADWFLNRIVRGSDPKTARRDGRRIAQSSRPARICRWLAPARRQWRAVRRTRARATPRGEYLAQKDSPGP